MNRPSRDVLEHSQANNPKHSVRCFIFARKRTRGEQLRKKQSDFLYCIDIPKYYIIICLIVTFLVLCYNIFVATPYTGTEGRVVFMELVVSFVISVMASVVAYYLCKWLDGEDEEE